MMDTIRGIVIYVGVCGLVANFFMIQGFASVAMGADGSQVRKKRRLPIDSDAKIFGILFAIGGVIGLFCGTSQQFPLTEALAIPVMLSFVAGFAFSYWVTNKLNNEYMARAERNFAEGNYRDAMEDAREVARSSETMRRRASDLANQASDRHQQSLGLGA